MQSFGRTQARNATCPTYIVANAGCGTSLPNLAVSPSSNTKWTFEPVPGSNIYRWYIRMSVRASQLPACTCCHEEPALWRVSELRAGS
jgi:hypothetical protein